MFIIYGTKVFTKRYLKDLPDLCPDCSEQVKLLYFHQRKWFSIFWIPLFPYRNKYYKTCSRCDNLHSINKAEFIQNRESMSQIKD